MSAEQVSRRTYLRLAACGLAGGSGCLGRVTTDSRYPRTGSSDPSVREIDRSIETYVRDRPTTAAVARIYHRGNSVLQRGYGWRDRDRSEPVRPDDLFRIASVTKPITAAAIRELARNDHFDLEDAAVSHLALDLPPNADPRLEEVTLEHLLSHRGGWDRNETYDPMLETRQIAENLGLDRRPTVREIASYVFREELTFDPGSRAAYSNFGYALLGILLEDVTGEPYLDVVRSTVLEPHDIDDVKPARSRLRDRHSREVRYRSSRRCWSAINLESVALIECADGGYDLAASRASGGLVASTRALTRFAEAYLLDGRRADDVPESADGTMSRAPTDWWTPLAEGGEVAYGMLAGTLAVVYRPSDRVIVAALFNARPNDPGEFVAMLRERLPPSIESRAA